MSGPLHSGVQRHPCEREGCSKSVPFDDEPFCFEHSPDEGSSVRGYSYVEKYPRRGHRFSLVIEAVSADDAWEQFWDAVSAGPTGFDTFDVKREDVTP